MPSNSLNLPHANSVLIELLKGKVLKTKLQSIVRNFYSLNTLLKEMKNDGLIDIELQPFGKNIQYISLTPYGREVAKKLKEAEEVAESPDPQEAEGVIHIGGEDIDIKLTPEERENSKYLKFLFHFNVMDNHITVEEAVPGKRSRIFNIYVKQNGNGIFRLWCEQDNSYDCWHIKEAWGYPQVQQMMMHYTGKTKICPVCSHENRENANFCENCGAKLECN
jgi:DNA-binding HxlR family transcriptional regulator